MGLRSGLDERRFDELVRAHAGAVRAYARSIAPDAWAADDACQETFLRAWRYLDSFRGSGSFEGWLIRICRNVLIDAAGRERTWRDALHGDNALARLAGAETAEADAEVWALIAGLPLAQREVVVLCGVLGYSYDGAAEILAVPVGTVRSRLHRARQALGAAESSAAGADAGGGVPRLRRVAEGWSA